MGKDNGRVILEPIWAFGVMTVYSRKPRNSAYAPYVVGNEGGRLQEDFKRLATATKWAKANRNG